MERKKIDLKKYTEIKEEVKTKEQKITIDQFIENITNIRKEDQLPEDHEIWQETPIIEEYNPVKYWKKHFRNWGIKDIPEEIWEILTQQAIKEVEDKKKLPINFTKEDIKKLNEKALEIEQLAQQACARYSELYEELMGKQLYFFSETTGFRLSLEEYEEEKERLKEKTKPEHSPILDNYQEKTNEISKLIKWLNILYKKHFDVPEQEELYRIRKDRYALRREDGVEPWQTGLDGEIIKAITAHELKKAVVKAGIPLIKELDADSDIPHLHSFDGQYREDTLSYGFFDSGSSSVFPEGWLHFTIFEPGIFLGVSVHEEEKLKEIWWTWPDLHKDRVELLKEIYESIIQVGANHPEENFISELEKKLLILRIDERITLCEKEIKTTSGEEKKIELLETEIKDIEKIWLLSKFFTSNLYEYFKRGFDFSRSYFDHYTIKTFEDFNKSIHGVGIQLKKKTKNKKEHYAITISNNIRDKYSNYQVFFSSFQDVLTAFKIFDKIIRNFGYIRIDEIFDVESLDYLLNKEIEKKQMYRAINDYFLQFETFNFDTRIALEQIAKKPIVKGMNWKQYVEEYELSLAGKTQDEIALKYGVTQQAISGHRQKIKGELARMIGEAYEKWLVDKYKAELSNLEVLRKGGKGEADLIVTREDGLIEVINAKAYEFSLSRPTFTIPAKEYQPEIEEARELEKEGKDVIVYIDFFNLYNKERYPRIPIDHNKPPERVTIRFEDYLK